MRMRPDGTWHLSDEFRASLAPIDQSHQGLIDKDILMNTSPLVRAKRYHLVRGFVL